MRLQGKSAIVTGGASGIGRAIALCMAKEGADISIPDINLDGAQQVAKEVEGLNRKVLALKCDVSRAEDVEAIVKRTLEAFGKIDILVNNAGVDFPAGLHFTENTEEEWDRAFQINVRSMVLTSKAVAPHMMERRSGKIINLASIAGQLGSATSAPYSVSKGAVITLTRCFARDLAPYGINVNAICPGLLWTSMWERIGTGFAKTPALANLSPREIFEKRVKEWVPMQREQVPEDIGWAAVFLASDESRNITGQSLNVDGGVYMH